MPNSVLRDCLSASGTSGALKMNKRGLITYIAKSNGVSNEEAMRMYDCVIDAIRDVVTKNVKLSLSGFGVFQAQKHKGQPVQFCESDMTVQDYLVFKFSASKTLNQYLRDHAQVV